MNRHLLREWRRRVRSDDTIICLGDVAHPDAWRDRRLVLDIRDCPGNRVLMLGNHDLNRAALREAGSTTQCSLALCATDPPLALSHYPLRQIPVGAVNLHGHLHEGTEPTRRHINLAVEQTDYSPVGLIWVLDKARQRQLAGQSIQGGLGSEALHRTARFGRAERCPPNHWPVAVDGMGRYRTLGTLTRGGQRAISSLVLGEDGVEPGTDQAAERDLLLVGDRPQLVPNLRIDVDGDHHAGRTTLVGLDRPLGAPLRGEPRGLLKIGCCSRSGARDPQPDPGARGAGPPGPARAR